MSWAPVEGGGVQDIYLLGYISLKLEVKYLNEFFIYRSFNKHLGILLLSNFIFGKIFLNFGEKLKKFYFVTRIGPINS